MGRSSLVPDLVAQHFRQERHEFPKTADVCYLPRRNVLHPADHAVWQSGVHVQVQDEGAVGAQFEPVRFRGREWSGSRNVSLLLTRTRKYGGVRSRAMEPA